MGTEVREGSEGMCLEIQKAMRGLVHKSVKTVIAEYIYPPLTLEKGEPAVPGQEVVIL